MRRLLAWLGIALGIVFLVVVVAAPPLLRGPLTRAVNARLDGALPGYTLHADEVRLRPLALGMELRELHVTQDAHPAAPLVRLPRVRTGLRALPLLRARLAAVAAADGAVLRAGPAEVRQAIRDRLLPRLIESSRETLDRTGVTVDEASLLDGTLRYEAEGAAPLEAQRLELRIRHIPPPSKRDDPRPSELSISAVVPDGNTAGTFRLHGRGDVLTYPDPPLAADFDVSDMPLTRMAALVRRFGIVVHAGRASASGHIDTARDHTDADVHQVRLDDLAVDYIHRPGDLAEAREAGARAKRKAGEAARQNVRLHLGRARLRRGTFGYVNRSAEVPYRLFVDRTTLTASNLSDGFRTGPAHARVRTRLMGTGDVRVDATMRPERQSGPDFDLEVQIAGADLTTLNDLLRSTAKLSLASGAMDFYSQVQVRNRRIEGYAKPLLKDVKVAQTDASLLDRAYKGAANAVVGLFQNRNDQVATRTSLSGPLDDPRASTWEAIVGLVRNAYVKAILPGLER